MTVQDASTAAAPRGAARGGRDFPWWLVAAVALALAVAAFVAASDLYSQVFAVVAKGVQITLFVTLVGYALASALAKISNAAHQIP